MQAVQGLSAGQELAELDALLDSVAPVRTLAERGFIASWRGRRIGQAYRIVRHLGSGGMAHVFLVQHVSQGTLAAAKVLAADAGDHAQSYFEREAALLASLDHPHIVRSLAHGRLLTGEPYVIMEYVRGTDLASYLDRVGRLPAPRALWIVRQLATAIDYLHGLGIVHRDIKPANIMIDPEANDPVKLLDFGIARRLDQVADDEPEGLLAGTPAYMAPEQARGEPVGASMDDYALAAFALELLTGKPPFAHGSPMKLVSAVVNDPARLPSELGVDVPGLDGVMEKALAKQPADRYASAGDFVSALRRVLRPQTRCAAPVGGASEVTATLGASSGVHAISLPETALAEAAAG